MVDTQLVSVVIPTYDRIELAKRAIQSVLNQTYSNIEIIVVEDGSQSSLENWIASHCPGTVLYLRHDNNKGLAATRNNGWQAASGEYVAFLDDDDQWKANKIKKQMQKVSDLSTTEKNNTGVIYCGVEDYYQDDERTVVKLPINCGDLRTSILQNGIIPLSSTYLIPRKVLKQIDGFDEQLSSSIDADLWMKLADERLYARCIQEPLVDNYQLKQVEQMTSRTEERITGVRSFVDKWEPVMREWLGPAAGQQFIHRYYARVIGNLFANKLAQRELIESAQAGKATFNYNDEILYNTYVLVNRFSRVAGKSILPQFLYRMI